MRQRLRDRGADGASSVEYGLMIALIAAVIVVAVATLGTSTMGLFDNTCDSLQNNGNVACG